MTHLIIGAGGIASWLVPLLKHTLKLGSFIRVMDGDVLESRNLDRQLFPLDYIGWNKAEALADLHKIAFTPSYFEDSIEFDVQIPYSAIWCCADNHPARKACLEAVDKNNALMAIIGGNEYTDSEAYAYLPVWKGTAGDPRIYYPEILTDQSGDPLSPFVCQGQAQEQNRQLALANYLAAGFMVHLWWFITNHGAEVTLKCWPMRHSSNFASFGTKPYDLSIIAEHI